MSPSGYSGTPLVKKLGIKPGSVLALVSPPPGFRRELVGLPEDVVIHHTVRDRPDLTVWFVMATSELHTRVGTMAIEMGAAPWIAWPKKASGRKTDVTEDVVRRAGLANGLVDYKVCAITDVWSGLKFARRQRS